jgi:hypothetical protein
VAVTHQASAGGVWGEVRMELDGEVPPGASARRRDIVCPSEIQMAL